MSKQSEHELSKRDMMLLWRYCEFCKRHYQDKSYVLLHRAVMDEERRQQLAADCLFHMGELHELQMTLTKAIDACGDDDDDD